MTELAAGAGAPADAQRRGVARHPWRWFFLVSLVPALVVALPGSMSLVSRVNTDGFALLAALLVARACDTREPEPSETGRRTAIFAAAFVALLAVVWWEQRDVAALVLSLFTVIVTAVALSGVDARTPAIRELVRPLLRIGAPWSPWLVAVVAWPLLGAIGILISHLGEPAQIATPYDRAGLPASSVVAAVAAALPAALAWYGFAARRLLRVRSPLVTAGLVGLAPWLVVVLPMSVWSDELNQLVLGFSRPFDSFVGLSSAGSLAVGVVGVWVYQRSRGSLLPVLVFLSETTVVAFAVLLWSGMRFASGNGLSALMVGLHCLLAVALIVQGKMWLRARTP